MRDKLKFLFSVVCFIFLYPVFVKAQELPETLKTTYAKLSVGTNEGMNEKTPPEKNCQFWYFDEIKYGRLKFQACDEIKIDQLKITSSDPTKFGPAGWSKRYFGYDPQYISYTKDGTVSSGE